jgi:NAD(P)-dependent dehydrogenase (short-subunit alcohol dehydrogenase family)
MLITGARGGGGIGRAIAPWSADGRGAGVAMWSPRHRDPSWGGRASLARLAASGSRRGGGRIFHDERVHGGGCDPTHVAGGRTRSDSAVREWGGIGRVLVNDAGRVADRGRPRAVGSLVG